MSQPALELVYDDETFSVSEVTDAVNRAIRSRFGDDGVWVRGEIDGCRTGPNGHQYFSLVERTERAVWTLNVSFFAGVRQRLEPFLRRKGIRLADGLAVRVHGQLEVFAGRLSLRLDGIDPEYTLGKLALDRDALLRRLADQGLLERNRRLRFPVAPHRLGLVCSVGSAGHRDFLDELESSGLGWRLAVCDTRVQGAEAPAGIAAAVTTLANRGVEVIAVIRGGGARTDLAAFDSEPVALAIARCPVPVLTGVGHEIDRSVADEVAHRSLKTPTACAAALVDQVRGFLAAADQAWSGVARVAGRRLDAADADLVDRAHRIGRLATAAADRAGTSLATAWGRLHGRADAGLRLAEADLDARTARLVTVAPRILSDADRLLGALAARADALDPARTLARGWSITRRADGTLVRDPAEVTEGEVLFTTVAGGPITSRVERNRARPDRVGQDPVARPPGEEES